MSSDAGWDAVASATARVDLIRRSHAKLPRHVAKPYLHVRTDVRLIAKNSYIGCPEDLYIHSRGH